MQVILISSRLAKARSLTLSLRHVLGSVAIGVAVVVGLTGALYWLSLRFAAEVLPRKRRQVNRLCRMK